MSTKWPTVFVVAAAFAAGFGAHSLTTPVATVHAAAANRVFEIRTYVAPPGKLEALKTRFRDHTIKFFKQHNMESVGYFTPMDAPKKDDTLIYILAHPSREEAAKNWAAFQTDPGWVAARNESQKDGPLTIQGGVTSVFVEPTDFSPIK